MILEKTYKYIQYGWILINKQSTCLLDYNVEKLEACSNRFFLKLYTYIYIEYIYIETYWLYFYEIEIDREIDKL